MQKLPYSILEKYNLSRNTQEYVMCRLKRKTPHLKFQSLYLEELKRFLEVGTQLQTIVHTPYMENLKKTELL